MLSILLDLWAVFVLIAAVFVFKFLLNDLPNRVLDRRIQFRRFRKGEEEQSDLELMQWVRAFTSKEFEQYVAYLFDRNGYKTRVVGGTHDNGIDIFATKNNQKIFVQCKRLTDYKVRVDQVRDFYGAIVDKLDDGKGFYVTTSTYTQEAKDFANDKPLRLLGSEDLVAMIRRTKKLTEHTPKS